MTNLTDKWKKDELPNGHYYVKVIPDFEYSYDIAFYTDGYFELYSDKDIDQILIEVPSFEQWQTKLKENAQLKELLKEIRQQITTQVFGSPKLQLFKGTFDNELLAKIDQILGEE